MPRNLFNNIHDTPQQASWEAAAAVPKFELLFAAFDAKRQQENAVPVQVHASVCPALVLVCLTLVGVCPTHHAAAGKCRSCPGTRFGVSIACAGVFNTRSSTAALRLDFDTPIPERNPAIGCSSCIFSLLGPVDPSLRALSGRLKFTARHQKFN